VCAIVRPGHPILALPEVTLDHLAEAGWIVPPMGSVLRHRFELMFHSAGLQPPRQVIATTALVFLTKILQQTDYMAVVPVDVARHYAEFGMVAVVPFELSCRMDSFGIITRNDWLLSPGAHIVLQAVKEAAVEIYGSVFVRE
jgi:DNA-binding transcriptional LysR family regulator